MTTGAAPIKGGDVVAAKYLIERVLGQGGMGIVVAASHIQLGQRVALKFLLPSALGNPEVVARFAREARAAARIQSEHVARVLDVGELEPGTPYMVMEYLEGEDLECALGRRGPLPVAEAIDYVLQSCEAIAEAHALGIVHRDLKPSNLFLANRPGGKPTIKVLDFGISKSPESPENPGLTQTMMMLGSPPYMSPEQIKSSRRVDARSDIWSLGVILYELLTLQRPFESDSVPELLAAIMYNDPPAPSRHRTDIPPQLDQAVMRCFEKDPAGRFQNVAQLASAIGSFAAPENQHAVEKIRRLVGAISAVGMTALQAAEEPIISPSPPMSPPTSLPTSPPVGLPVAPPVARSVAESAAIDQSAVGARAFEPAESSRSSQLSPPSTPSSITGVPPIVVPIRAPIRKKRGPAAVLLTSALVTTLAVAAGVAAYRIAVRLSASPTPTETMRAPAQGLDSAVAGARTRPMVISTARPSPAASLLDVGSTRGPHGRLGATSQRIAAGGDRKLASPLPPAPAPLPAAETPTPTQPSSAVTRDPCADLLERQSLGETLTGKEKILYLEQCRKGKAR